MNSLNDTSLDLFYFFSSPEPKAHGELIVNQSSRCQSVHPSVRLFPLSNMIISTTYSNQILSELVKHHWGWGKAALCFGPDQIGTLVSMATDSSHRVMIGSSSYLQITRTTIISLRSVKFGQIRPRTEELAALEQLKKFP